MQRTYIALRAGVPEPIRASSSGEARRFCKRWGLEYAGRRGGLAFTRQEENP
jgi:hypothetical protein